MFEQIKKAHIIYAAAAILASGFFSLGYSWKDINDKIKDIETKNKSEIQLINIQLNRLQKDTETIQSKQQNQEEKIILIQQKNAVIADRLKSH